MSIVGMGDRGSLTTIDEKQTKKRLQEGCRHYLAVMGRTWHAQDPLQRPTSTNVTDQTARYPDNFRVAETVQGTWRRL